MKPLRYPFNTLPGYANHATGLNPWPIIAYDFATDNITLRAQYSRATALVEWLVGALPHGSGIDAKWNVELQPGRITADNAFHLMDGNGFYCGWRAIRVAITPGTGHELGRLFSTRVRGRDGDRLPGCVREYLNQLFHDFASAWEYADARERVQAYACIHEVTE